MNLLRSVQEASSAAGLPSILIGGHAVNIHGFARMTLDLGLLVKRGDATSWKVIFSRLNLTLHAEHQNFLQFQGNQNERLDLMLVNESTFAKMWDRAEKIEYLGADISVVAVEHLIALKLHVLRQDLEHRRIKDFLDIVELIRLNHLDLQSAEMQEIFGRYGTEDIMRRIQLAL